MKGTPITSVDEWLRLAPPKGGERHWQDGHSAKELARAWFPRPGFPTVPVELRHVLDCHSETRGAVIEQGSPEQRVRIDQLRGEPCTLDLTLIAHGKHGRIAITVEAKATEPFGPPLHTRAARADRLVSQGRPSLAAQRVHNILAALFGRHDATDPAVRDLRYQLLTATAGALAYAHEPAHRAKLAVLIIHEFAATETARHAEDLARFIAVLTKGAHATVDVGAMIGPFTPPGTPIIPAPIPLLVGRIRHAHA